MSLSLDREVTGQVVLPLNRMTISVGRIFAALVLLTLGSLVMAVVLVRLPALWGLVPDFWALLAQAFKCQSQECVADVEFFAAWMLCFVLIAAVAAAIMSAGKQLR